MGVVAFLLLNTNTTSPTVEITAKITNTPTLIVPPNMATGRSFFAWLSLEETETAAVVFAMGQMTPAVLLLLLQLCSPMN